MKLIFNFWLVPFNMYIHSLLHETHSSTNKQTNKQNTQCHNSLQHGGFLCVKISTRVLIKCWSYVILKHTYEHFKLPSQITNSLMYYILHQSQL